jgi:SsrA-binding protein
MMKMKTIIENRKTRFEYNFLETFEVGIVLTGMEVKAIRNNNVNMTDTYCFFNGNDLWVKNIFISLSNGDDKRERKLLLKKQELKKLKSKLINGLTIVPTKIYFNDRGFVKIEIVLAQGKKTFDKRNTIKERDIQRELQNKSKW